MKHFLFLFIFLFHLSVKAQILSDEKAKHWIIDGLDAMYNLDFKTADAQYQQIKIAYPNHPVNDLLEALKLSWQHLPIEKKIAILPLYFQHLDRCIELSKPLLESKKNYAEGVFFSLAAHSYKVLTYTYQKSYTSAIGEAKSTYDFMKKGMNLTSQYPEFYYSTGLYNYYVEQYPITHPITKPFMWFFGKGNKKLGIKYLDLATKNSVFTSVEASYYLTNIFLKYENTPQKALPYSQNLYKKYPKNAVYTMRHTEALIANGHYDEASKLVPFLETQSNKSFVLASVIFNGLIAEKNAQNDTLAQQYYQKAIKMSYDERYTKNYYSMAWAGLARIAIRQNKLELAKNYYKKCLDIAEYTGVIQEAKKYLE